MKNIETRKLARKPEVKKKKYCDKMGLINNNNNNKKYGAFLCFIRLCARHLRD